MKPTAFRIVAACLLLACALSKRIVTLLITAALLFTLTLAPGCGARRTPDLGRIFAGARARQGKRPVIVIPGILGSRIVNQRTGEVVWPSVFRSDVDGLSLPAKPDLAGNRDELVAARIVEAARLARIAPEVYVYHHLLRALEDYGGYREADWDNPPRTATATPSTSSPTTGGATTSSRPACSRAASRR